MNIQQKLTEIEQAGIKLSANGHNIGYEPKRKLTRDMALWLTANKPAVLKILNDENKQKKQLVYQIIEGLIRLGLYTDEVKGYAMRMLDNDEDLAKASFDDMKAFMVDIEREIKDMV